jgi:hypothetical protein
MSNPRVRAALSRRAFALLLLGVTACAPARATEVRGPNDGHGWVEISCRHGPDVCDRKAREVCGGPYVVREKDGRYVDGPGAAFFSGWMLIRCKEPPAQAVEG